MKPIRVLFLCTQNSARSQVAEALLSRKDPNRFETASAGTDPASTVHPLALKVLRRAGIDWSDRRPKSVEAVQDHGRWDLVITVCDRARETCPRIPGRPVTAHWGMPDPDRAEGDLAAREAVFWEMLTVLGRRIDLLVGLPDEKLRGMALRSTMAEMEASEERSNGVGT